MTQLPALCDVLVAEPRPISSWALAPEERAAWSDAPADEILTLREFALLAEWGELYLRGEGDEDIARLQPGYTKPESGVVDLSAAKGWIYKRGSGVSAGQALQLSWASTSFQVAGSVATVSTRMAELDRGAERDSAIDYAEYVNVCFSHLRNDCYSRADALRSANGEGWGSTAYSDWGAAIQSSSPDVEVVQPWADAGRYGEARSDWYTAQWAAAAADDEKNGRGVGGVGSGWISWEACEGLLERTGEAGFGPDCLRKGNTQGVHVLRNYTSSPTHQPQRAFRGHF